MMKDKNMRSLIANYRKEDAEIQKLREADRLREKRLKG
jgi:hypothetical protein